MAKKAAKPKAAEAPPPDEDDDSAPSAPPPKRKPAPPPQPMSVPAVASCLTFVVLLLAEIVTLVVLWWKPQIMPLSFTRIAIVTLLVLVVPIVVYRAISLWMYDERARFPDIARAWHAGLAQLARQGKTLTSAPLFIVVGTGNEKLRRNFIHATEANFSLDTAEDGAAPLYWFANSDAIFLYLNDISWMNAAIMLYEMYAAALRQGGPQMPGENPKAPAKLPAAGRYLGTLMPDPQAGSGQRQDRYASLPSDFGATVDFSQSGANPGNVAKGPAPMPAAGPPAGGRYLETLVPEQAAAASPAAAGAAPGARPKSVVSKHVSNRLSSHESSQQLQRLEHVCGLLRRHRHPVCPANGILALLPFEMLKAGDQDVAELERAIAADLSTMYRELQLRCPVTAVVVGMEQERGFREMIRRIGREGATKQRFGQRFDLRIEGTQEELRKFTSHVCGTFEDWVYTLFREEQALSHPGNTALYALLCKVRRTLKTRLGDVLGNGFGSDRQSGRPPVLFSGCYFAATGPKSDRQAFVSGLVTKLYDEQEDIEWTAEALREDQRRGWLTRLGWVLCLALVLCLVGWFLVDRFFT
jgi:hypothetical protein